MHPIKRYANRKLYDTKDKKYITLDKIAKLLKAGDQISVTDNETGEDITAATVSQIIARDKKGKSDNAASNVMIQLLRKGPGTLVDYGKKYVSLWDRALTMADEEIDRLIERLVKENEISASEGNKLKKDMVRRAENLKKWMAEKTDQRINEALNMMNLASREQITQLTEKIDKLTSKVQRLEKKLAQKAAEEEARKKAAKPMEPPTAKVIPLSKEALKPVEIPESSPAENSAEALPADERSKAEAPSL